MKPGPENKSVRFVRANDGVIYIHAQDVVDMIRLLAGGEETDVRERWNELATNIALKANLQSAGSVH